MILNVFIWGFILSKVTSLTIPRSEYLGLFSQDTSNPEDYSSLSSDDDRASFQEYEEDGEAGAEDYEEDPEIGPYLEGDIMAVSQLNRNGVPLKEYIWDKGVIPYFLDTDFSKKQKSDIQLAMQQIQDKSCVKFQELHNPSDTNPYVHITRSSVGCSAKVGKQTMEEGNDMMLSRKCFKDGVGRVIHELIHSIGFYHEHTREDRDPYIKIIDENVKEGMEHCFTMRTSNPYGKKYDYDSIMHYPRYACSKNPGKATTIQVLQAGAALIGQRTHISVIDAEKINAMYKEQCTATLAGLARRYRAYVNLYRNRRRWT